MNKSFVSHTGEMVFERGVAKLFGDSFQGNKKVKRVKIPMEVEEIGNEYFKGCTSLEEVTFERESLCVRIGREAFAGCSNLKKIVLPLSLQFIEEKAFRDCERLEKIYIPQKCTFLGNKVFEGCADLSKAFLGNVRINCGFQPFRFCFSLRELYIGGKMYVTGPCDLTVGAVFSQETNEKGELQVEMRLVDYIEKGEIEGQTVYWLYLPSGWRGDGPSLEAAREECKFRQNRELYKTELFKKKDVTETLTLSDVKIITGACKTGIDRFAQEAGINMETSLPTKAALIYLKNCELYMPLKEFVDAQKQVNGGNDYEKANNV